LDGISYPVTIRAVDDGYKISFENRKFYITSKWILGNKIFDCVVNGQSYSLQLETKQTDYIITFKGRTVRAQCLIPRAAEMIKYMKPRKTADDRGELIANISGRVVEVKVEVGAQVFKDQPVVVLEAMKMENIINSPRDGVVQEVCFKAGDNVSNGEVIIKLEEK
jgi:propionyl-CoA carboxylase alpha chain